MSSPSARREVLYKTDENGKKTEPMELTYIDVPEEFSGTVIEKLSKRKGELKKYGTGFRRLYETGIFHSFPGTHRLSWRIYDRYQG